MVEIVVLLEIDYKYVPYVRSRHYLEPDEPEDIEDVRIYVDRASLMVDGRGGDSLDLNTCNLLEDRIQRAYDKGGDELEKELTRAIWEDVAREKGGC